MKQKLLYQQSLNEMRQLSSKYKLPQDLMNQIGHLEKEMSEFVIKVPIVGGFNAGKSSLINTFLGDGLLPVDILPETAIAAEIKYGLNEIVAHDFDGNTKKFELSELKKIDANTYKHIEVLLDNPKLKELEDVVLVDMPGFDSGIAEHNKAIFQYLKEGVVFLIVVECSDGSLKSSVSNFLYELDAYELNFGIIANKVDKVTESMKEKVVSNLKQVVSTMSKDATVYTASDRLENGNDEFHQFLKGLNNEQLFTQQFKTKVQQIIQRVKMNLEVLLNNSDSNAEVINTRIKELETKIKQLDSKFKTEEVQITHKIRNEVKETILKDVQTVLFNESHSLALSARAGETSFSQKVNELTRPILISSTNQQLELTFSDLVKKMSHEMKDMASIAQGVSKANKALEDTLAQVSAGLEGLSQNEAETKKYEKLFKVSVGSLAIVTTVVAPWIELILFFLPDILKVFGFNSEEKQLEKLQKEIESQVIPQIVGKIRNNIGDSLEKVKEEVIEDLKKEMQEEMQDLYGALQQSIIDKQKAEKDFENYIQELRADIEEVDNTMAKTA